MLFAVVNADGTVTVILKAEPDDVPPIEPDPEEYTLI
jgi:hypothetical protein